MTDFYDGIFHSIWIFWSDTSLAADQLQYFGNWQKDNCLTYVGWYGGLYQDLSYTNSEREFSNFDPNSNIKLERESQFIWIFDPTKGFLLWDKTLKLDGDFEPGEENGFSIEFWFEGEI